MAEAEAAALTGLSSLSLNSGSGSEEPEVKFKCGDQEFALTKKELEKIPYLEGLSSWKFRDGADSNGVIPVNRNICKPDLLMAVIRYIKTGRERRLFTSLPETAKPTELFSLLDFLGVKKPNRTLAEIDKDLKNVVTEYDKYGRNGCANRSKARDTAVILCWIGTDLVTCPKMQLKVDMMVVYIMSHARTFYLKIRRCTMDWYLETFTPTPKQVDIIRNWWGQFQRTETKLQDLEISSSGGSSSSDEYCYYSS